MLMTIKATFDHDFACAWSVIAPSKQFLKEANAKALQSHLKGQQL